MNLKRFVWILVGVVLIAFGISALSLRYNDNLSFKNFNSSNRLINIGGNNDVKIGSKGLEVIDGDKYVSISWDGIKVIDGDEKVSIGWTGIKVDDGNKTKVDIGRNNWFNSPDLEWFSFDEEKFVEIDNQKTISIFSKFIDIEIISEKRKDVKILYKGEMKSNTAPELEINKKTNEIEINLVDENTNNYIVANSDIVLAVFIPKDYEDSIKVLSTSSNIEIEDFALKQLNLISTTGDIEIDKVKGNILKLVTTSGDIDIDDSSGSLDIKTTSGNIEIDNKYNDKEIKISSTSGNVYINFAENANYTIKGTTTSGDFKPSPSFLVDWTIIDNVYGKNKFEGITGKEGNIVEIKTTSGDIKLNME